jgi:threonine/homoserine efflux transporter RhtA
VEVLEMRVSLRSIVSAGTFATLLSLLTAIAALAGDGGGPFPK